MLTKFAHEGSTHAHASSDGQTIIYIGIVGLLAAGLIGLAVFMLGREKKEQSVENDD